VPRRNQPVPDAMMYFDYSFTPPKFLRQGDVVRIEISGIGVLENPVA
jgi:2-keto-4-pentenoate hydratase/2-oxohepta-3-ene-1,7-dioic acid hydratase in catechol pathway